MARSRNPAQPAIPDRSTTLVAHVQAQFEAERERLARHLHREVAGVLAAARMELSRLTPTPAADDADSRERLARVDQLLATVIRDAQLEMQRLYPALLDHFGLSAALHHLAEQACRADLSRCTLELPDLPGETVSRTAALAAYRAVEALLAGRATAGVCLRLRPSAERLQLSAQVDHASPPTADAGRTLLAVGAWLESLGGTWSVSVRGDTTSLELELPRQTARAADS